MANNYKINNTNTHKVKMIIPYCFYTVRSATGK